ncbi:MAG: hypothetical protein Q9M92_05830 [Enterobacterales bacterium]|nr:hypothetical protein [Enterobacterales bacterium]
MILMDTCAIIWDALEVAKLSDKAIAAIEIADQKDSLIISDISMCGNTRRQCKMNSDLKLIQPRLVLSIYS